MTAQIIDFNKSTEIKSQNSCGKEYTHWSEEYSPENRESLENDFISDLCGTTLICQCGDCHTRDDAWTFLEGCPSCGGNKELTFYDKNTAEDFIRKWPVQWGWAFGSDLTKPIGCLGRMPWGRFDTIDNTLTYDAGDKYVTVALPPINETVVDLHAFGMLVFEKMHNASA
jgi:hypothetical protein